MEKDFNGVKLFECCFNCEHECKNEEDIYYHKCDKYIEDSKRRNVMESQKAKFKAGMESRRVIESRSAMAQAPSMKANLPEPQYMKSQYAKASKGPKMDGDEYKHMREAFMSARDERRNQELEMPSTTSVRKKADSPYAVMVLLGMRLGLSTDDIVDIVFNRKNTGNSKDIRDAIFPDAAKLLKEESK